ncbi:MAG: type I DNA topoisomerase [Lachnospiraceae bacterium]|nr:type I DNA topoisomerase [Clostridia bacterium]MBQ6076265.1 type I DNA topoisomerase [Lachnospiraceae bacterium]
MAGHPLIIVESPTKEHTIKRFLGSNYSVKASGGHLRDLPKSRMGVDIENDYEPEYISIRGKGDVIKTLKNEAKKATKVYLATDPDREGEAIAWHLAYLLKDVNPKLYRISFNEITKDAVKAALADPRAIDTELVDAQQARRVLDRVAGYSVSPLLWKKIKRGLSAGRVQSATLNMVVSRDREIDAFDPEEYWTLEAALTVEGRKAPLILQYDNKPHALRSEADTQEMIAYLAGRPFEIRSLTSSRKRVKAPNPFTTSTLQQEASRILGFSPSKTMRVAQTLYEGVKLAEGTVGLITYLRTDSTRIGAEADAAARAFLKDKYGEEFVGKGAAAAKKDERIQDAHEAIRPTSIERTPEKIRDQMGRDELRLYQLIWNRFAASRMADYQYDAVTLTAAAGEAVFRAAAQNPVFQGYRLLYNHEDKQKTDRNLVGINEDSVLTDPRFTPEQHFTQPPAHYTEASLVQSMEAAGIGRPSTYAPTLATLMDRHYTSRKGKNVIATDLGRAVDDMIVKTVPMLADRNFTAEMETRLDKVAEGEEDWKELLRTFYPPFKEKLDTAMDELERVQVKDEESDEVCELCGRRMVIKYGRHGKFLACPGFPECKNTKPFLEAADVPCPQCGGRMILRRTAKGRRFYACENKECGFMSWNKPKA